jgi:hypothetical protein
MILSRNIFCAFIGACLIPLSGWGQKDIRAYKENAESMRKEVWSWDKPEFSVRNIPSEYNNFSKVVIARHIDIGIKKNRLTNFVLTEIFRESIKINDKAAVTEFSDFEYNQMEKGSGFTAGRTTITYVGVRVIKPNGNIKEINADDIVITASDKDLKKAKIAIPDLQAGDILDYFVAREGTENLGFMEVVSAYVFEFYNEVPILHYSIHSETGKRYAIEYRSYNGAPDFIQRKGEDNSNVLDLVQKNIPVYPEIDLWTLPYRQLPLTRMNIIVGYKGVSAGRFNARDPGVIYKNQPSEKFFEDEMNDLGLRKISTGREGVDLPEELSEYLKKLVKSRSDIPADSFAAELFYVLRYSDFLDVQPWIKVETIMGRANRDLPGKNYKYHIYDFLKDKGADASLVVSTHRSLSTSKEIMGKNELDYLIQIRGNKPKFMGMSSIFTPAFYIPTDFEGEKNVLALDIGEGRSPNPDGFGKSRVNIPAGNAENNSRLEKMEIAVSDDRAGLFVNRITSIRGHERDALQKQLILFEDYCNAERKAFNIKSTILEQLEGGRKTKSYADELRFAFSKARQNQKDEFLKEATGWFGLEVTNLSDFHVQQLGVRHYQPDFVYSSKFKLGGLVKKAGANFIIEIGKLQGSLAGNTSIPPMRKLDIYLPFAETLSSEISVVVPEGFTLEGAEALNVRVENETGQFSCETKLSGSTLIIKTSKTYNSAFIPATNWDKLKAIIDAEKKWYDSKILFRKK